VARGGEERRTKKTGNSSWRKNAIGEEREEGGEVREGKKKKGRRKSERKEGKAQRVGVADGEWRGLAGLGMGGGSFLSRSATGSTRQARPAINRRFQGPEHPGHSTGRASTTGGHVSRYYPVGGAPVRRGYMCLVPRRTARV